MSLGTKISVTKAQRAIKYQAKRKRGGVKMKQLPATKLGKWCKEASALKVRRYNSENPWN